MLVPAPQQIPADKKAAMPFFFVAARTSKETAHFAQVRQICPATPIHAPGPVSLHEETEEETFFRFRTDAALDGTAKNDAYIVLKSVKMTRSAGGMWGEHRVSSPPLRW
jgi:hypothetical protein